MSSQKIGPSSFAIRVICWIGAPESTDSILPTTGFFGGCGIGLSLFVDAIVNLSPDLDFYRHCEEHLRRSNPSRHEKKEWIASLRSQ
jgi:hypothetical protein